MSLNPAQYWQKIFKYGYNIYENNTVEFWTQIFNSKMLSNNKNTLFIGQIPTVKQKTGWQILVLWEIDNATPCGMARTSEKETELLNF